MNEKAYCYKPRQSTRKTVDTLKPLELKGNRDLGIMKLLIFGENKRIVISIVSERGMVNFRLTPKTASELACALTRRLVEQPTA